MHFFKHNNLSIQSYLSSVNLPLAWHSYQSENLTGITESPTQSFRAVEHIPGLPVLPHCRCLKPALSKHVSISFGIITDIQPVKRCG